MRQSSLRRSGLKLDPPPSSLDARASSPDSMPCLTVIQPWASLIAAGIKRVETRNWIRRDLIGSRLAIHAASRWTAEQQAFARSSMVASMLQRAGVLRIPLGAVVGTVRVVGFQEWMPLNWEERRRLAMLAMGDQDHGQYAWLLAEANTLTKPFPAAGQRGLWRWSEPNVATT